MENGNLKMENKMRIIFFGTPKEVIPVLKNLTTYYEVVAVVTAPDKKSGRKQLLTPSPVKTYAQKNNIPVFEAENLSLLKPDLFIVAAFGKLISSEIVDLPKYGAINIHPSLLPTYRGSTPIQTALLHGDAVTGVTFIKMDEQMDHGPILHQIPFTIEETDTFDWLMQSTFAQAGQILPHVIDDYVAGKIAPLPQDDNKATYTKKITKEDGYIDLTNPPDKVKLDRMIRAYYPWPTVWARTTLTNREVIIKFLPKKTIQVEGKNPVTIKDFLNGYPQMREKIEKLF